MNMKLTAVNIGVVLTSVSVRLLMDCVLAILRSVKDCVASRIICCRNTGFVHAAILVKGYHQSVYKEL